jgi:DNA-binding response OmpR family regulator
MGQAPADRVGERPGPAVLLAEHDAAVAAMLVRYLARDGFDVRLAGTPELALAELCDAGAPPAAAVLDLTMPALDPRRVRRALRTPVVFLVAPGPRPRGLNGTAGKAGTAGPAKAVRARRWLIRPFGPRQLVAAVQEVLREDGEETARPAPAPIEIDGLRLDPARRIAILKHEDREVPLTEGECRVLAAMLAVPGRPRSRRQLLEATGRTASDRAADVYIAQLRAKIPISDLIRTVRGAGYAIGTPGVPAPELGGMPNRRGQ